MDERELQPFDDDTASAGGGLSGRQLVIIGAVALAMLAAGVWFITRTPKPVEEPAPRRVESVPEGSRTVTLYFADAEEAGIRPETREIAVGHRLDEQVRQVVDALIAGPSNDRAVSALPEGTQLLSVMVDADSGTVYLDFSSELVAAHPGGSAAEYCTVASIVRTVGENFPELESVQLLVDDSQVESIAGHVRADQPLFIREWR
ncbi:MAG TPA: GerMN domain-containing protein [Candidatus Krumholzibacteria bacterium]